jgi:hypothetical protein
VYYVFWWQGKAVQKSVGRRKQSPLYYYILLGID